ncbi:MAG: O-antigen ligase family protein [Chloroflexota bacterium]|nr:O-antigen ligase family protein [Chloroflexota bacterium]
MTGPRPLAILVILLLAVPLTVSVALFPLPTVAVLFAVLVVGIVVALPEAGLYLLIALFLVQSSPLYEQYAVFGQQATVADLVGLLALASYAGHAFLRRSTEQASPPSSRGLMGIGVVTAYYVWQLLSVVWSPAVSSDLDLFARQAIESIVLFALLVLVLDTPRRLRGAAAVYAITGFGLATYTIGSFAGGGGFAATLASSSATFRGGLPSTFNVNELALITALVPGFTALASGARTAFTRIFLTAGSVVVVAPALLILDSRGSFIAAIVGVLAAVALSRGKESRAAFGAAMVLGGILLIAAVSTNHVPYYVLQDPTRQLSYGDLNGRGPIWQAALTVFEQHPIIGAGADGFNTLLPGYHITSPIVASTHNDYLQAMADQGIIGLALLLAMLSVVGHAAVIGSRRNPGSIANFAICVISMSAGSFLLIKWFLPTLGLLYCAGLAGGALSRPVRVADRPRRDFAALATEFPPS